MIDQQQEDLKISSTTYHKANISETQPLIAESSPYKNLTDKRKPLSVYKLCSNLEEKNKFLMGRILAVLDSDTIHHFIAEACGRVEQGAIDSKSGLFLRLVKEYLRSSDPDKIDIVFVKNKRKAKLIKQQCMYISDQCL